MIVTNIVDFKKNKVLVECDRHLVFPLYKSEIRKYHIVENGEMDSEVKRELFEEILPKRAKIRAMHLLTKRSYTENGIYTKLSESRYIEEHIEEAISYLKGFGYIDDYKYVLDYINTYKDLKSIEQIRWDLYKKGISKDLFDMGLLEYQEKEGSICHRELIKKLLQKKHYNNDMEHKNKQKIITSLARKGFSIDLIVEAMGEIENV